MSSRSARRFALTCLLTAPLIFSCNTAPHEDPGPPEYDQVKAPTEATAYPVSIAQMKFIPDTLRVHVGDTVVFTNNDVVDHDATALPDSSWSSHALHPGDSWSWVADKTSDYFCSIHVVMRGVVVVE